MLIVAVFIGLIILYVREFPYFSNTLHVGSLVRRAILAAAVLGLLSLTAGYATGTLDKADRRLHAFLLLAAMAFAPLVASFTNRMGAARRPYSVTFDYIGQKAKYIALFGARKGQPADTYWLYVRREGRDYMFRTRGTAPMSARTGSRVRLLFRRGLWGYDFFDGKSWEFI